MNTTREFDRIAMTTPPESSTTIRFLAALRLCIVILALVLCVLLVFGIRPLPMRLDLVLIIGGIFVGTGQLGDGIERVPRWLGLLWVYAILLVLLAVQGALWLSDANGVLIAAARVWGVVYLLAVAWNLMHLIRAPTRAVRHRQIQRHLRSLPRAQRAAHRQTLYKSFDGIAAEGFD